VEQKRVIYLVVARGLGCKHSNNSLLTIFLNWVIGFTQKGYKSNANFLELDLNQALPIKKQFDLISS
jgi:hypothetical protein